jgi:hypothetical protein
LNSRILPYQVEPARRAYWLAGEVIACRATGAAGTPRTDRNAERAGALQGLTLIT